MTHKRNPLTQEQLDWARKQYAKGEQMRQIAIVLHMKPDWLKCLIDPEFHERRRLSRRATAAKRREKSRALYGDEPVPETDMQSLANKRAITSDLNFINAMQGAIRKGVENASMMTRRAPSTDSPRFVPHRSQGVLSVTGSSSQSCADFA